MNISSHHEALDAGTPFSWILILLGSSALVNCLQNRLKSWHPWSCSTWISLFPQLAAASGNETFPNQVCGTDLVSAQCFPFFFSMAPLRQTMVSGCGG